MPWKSFSQLVFLENINPTSDALPLWHGGGLQPWIAFSLVPISVEMELGFQ